MALAMTPLPHQRLALKDLLLGKENLLDTNRGNDAGVRQNAVTLGIGVEEMAKDTEDQLGPSAHHVTGPQIAPVELCRLSP